MQVVIDIYNIKLDLKRKELGSRILTSTFISTFNIKGILYKVK